MKIRTSYKTFCEQNVLFLVTLLCTMLLLTTVAFAAPAADIPRECEQPSGERFSSIVQGDEWFNWRTAETGEIIMQDEEGYWCYAELGEDTLKPGKHKYMIDPKPEKALKDKDIKDLKAKKADSKPSKEETIAPEVSILTEENSNLQEAINALRTEKTVILLTSFSDIKISSTPSEWYEKFFGTTGSTVTNYYEEVSGGQFNFVPAAESQGNANDGIINVTLKTRHPNTGSNTGSRNQRLAKDAMAAADPYINYASYDVNRDGKLTANELHIIVVCAGYEAAISDRTPSVWAHSWSTTAYLDGVSLGKYTQEGELHGNYTATIGLVSHELGHDIGLPDLYDYDSSSNGVGAHSLMAAGSWARLPGGLAGDTPTHLDAYCKVKLGWVQPTIISASGSYNLNSFDTGSYNVLRINTTDPRQYFLVENRQLIGYDRGLTRYGVNYGGIAIWHIDESIQDNNNESRKLVDLEEANEGALGYSQLDTAAANGGDHYYCSGYFTSFNSTTTPNSNLYNGAGTGLEITVSSGSSSSMLLDITR